jgi:hypothetical protein
MTLKDILDQLSTGELSNLFTFDDDTNEVSVTSIGKVVPQLNLGLQLLYNRFFLREGSEVVNMVEGTYTYPLTSTDILRVEQIKDLEDNEYLLNIEGDPESMMMAGLKTLKTPTEKYLKPTTLEVIYRAGPVKLNQNTKYLTPVDVEVDLPSMYMEPLVLFIASRFLNPMGAGEGFHEGNNYAAKYEQACQLLERQNYDLDRQGNHNRFHANGWV